MRIPVTILAVILIILAAIFWLSPKHLDAPVDDVYPWDIKTTDEGNITAFGITLGQSPLRRFMDTVRDEGETAIFVEEGKEPSVEAFFKTASLGGFQAKIIAIVGVPQATLEDWANRARKMSTQASGSRKIKLMGQNLEEAKNLPVISITYLPRVAYDDVTVRQRFGEPENITKISDKEQYWFYPKKGLIMNINAESREVLHYLLPPDYAKVRTDILNLTTGNSDKNDQN